MIEPKISPVCKPAFETARICDQAAAWLEAPGGSIVCRIKVEEPSRLSLNGETPLPLYFEGRRTGESRRFPLIRRTRSAFEWPSSG